MRKILYNILIIYVIILFNNCLYAQIGHHIAQEAHVKIQEHASSIWGYTDSLGVEYALLGTSEGVRIYSLEDPKNPIERKFIQGTSCSWRELKTSGEFAYIVTECGDGLLIVDMRSLDFKFVTSFYNAKGDTIKVPSSHTLFVDENQFIYLSGSTGFGGFIILDPRTNPWQPELIHVEPSEYMHEVHVYRDTLYAAVLFNGVFSIYDIHDKTNPIRLVDQESSGHFTHSVWREKDRNILYTADETSGASVEAWDVSDIYRIKKTDAFKLYGSNARYLIPHNVFHKEDKLFVAYYTEGVRILDTRDPYNLLEVAYYDTDTLTAHQGGFHGCWSIYPYFKSGLLIASDIESGLFVLRYDQNPAAYLTVRIVDSTDQTPISNARLSIDYNNKLTDVLTDLKGQLRSGIDATDSVTIKVNAKGYYEKTLRIYLQQNQTFDLEIALTPLPKHTLSLRILDAVTKLPIQAANVSIRSNDIQLEGTANDLGELEFQDIYEANWEFFAGSWGYQQAWIPSYFNGRDSNYVLYLESGYEDDFVLDLGWIYSGIDLNIKWKRGDFSEIPVPSSNFPSKDIEGDLGSQCLYTDNIDKDESFYRLIDSLNLYSPWMDLSSFESIDLSYTAWAYGGFLSTKTMYLQLNDSLIFLESIPENLNGLFNPTSHFNLDVSNLKRDSARLFFSLYNEPATAQQAIRLMAALDGFKLTGKKISSTQTEKKNSLFHVIPNPAGNFIQLVSEPEFINSELAIYDQTGRKVYSNQLQPDSVMDVSSMPSGFYFLSIEGTNRRTKFIKL